MTQEKIYGYAKVDSHSTILDSSNAIFDFCNKMNKTPLSVITDFYKESKNYEALKEVLVEGTVLVIDSLNSLGKSLKQVLSELRDLTAKKVKLVVMDCELLNDFKNDKLKQDMTTRDFVVELITYLAMKESEQVKTRQKCARKEGKHIGRPKQASTIDFSILYRMFLDNKTKEAIELSGLSRATFYRRVEQYEKEHNLIRFNEKKDTEINNDIFRTYVKKHMKQKSEQIVASADIPSYNTNHTFDGFFTDGFGITEEELSQSEGILAH